MSSRGLAYVVGISCGVCGGDVGVMFNHNLMDRKEIFDMLEEKGTQIICLKCHNRLLGKEGLHDNTTEKLK